METLDKQSLWESVLTELQLTLSGATFQTWFKGKTNILSVKKDMVEIGCVSPYNKVWVEERYLGKLKEIIDRITGQSNTLVFTVSSGNFHQAVKKIKAATANTVPLFEEEASEPIKESLVSGGINPKYSLSSFIVGQTNQLAYSVAKAVADGGANRYNPLLIHGGVGVGKTHLLQALGHAAILRRSGLRALYCSSESFTNDMVAAIQRRQTVDFRARYRDTDLLLVDDIQFIAGRESTQEEFFHTFNHLMMGGKQLVLSCDRNPEELSNLQDRLKNRFSGGMVAAIEPPDLELREAVLLSKAQNAGVTLDFSIIRTLAETLGPSIRELEGGFLRLLAVSKLTGKGVDLALVKNVVGLGKRKGASVNATLQETANYFSVPVAELRGASRAKACVFPRQVAMYLLRIGPGLSFKQIASYFGGKDHTTAIYSVNKVESLVEKGGEVSRVVGDLKNKVFGS
jgi:chromosomal replication initiator protein